MPTIDNKVVQMTFDNKQFERGVKESIRSLDDLKKALDLDRAADSLSNLEKTASKFDISGIAAGVENIADKFTLLGNIGQEVFHRISKTAVDAMEGAWRTVTGMPKAGLSKYEMKNKAVQMIQGALPDKSIEEIEEVLGRLNEYTDLTSYDFSQMANSIGKFTAAGVDLDVAEKVMEGIANEAASAGGEIQQANIAMYNFSQALAAGAVKALDWKSIENQNLATKEFKETIIDTASELGILKKKGDGVGVLLKKTSKGTKQIVVNYENFRETLSDGWFTSDVLIKTMEKYADRESDVGKKGFEMAKIAITITQAFDAVKDAISTQWMKTWQLLLGNLEEAGELFTRISDALIDFTDKIGNFRNSILEGWHTGGEDGISGYQAAIDALSNSWHTLMGIAEATSRAFQDVFGTIDSSGLIDATVQFRDYTKQIAEFFGYTTEEVEHTQRVLEITDGIEAWTDFIQKGMRGDEVEKLQKHLLALKDPLIRLDGYGADGIFGPETQAALKAFQKSVGLAETGIYDESTRDALAKALYPNGKPKKTWKTTYETVEHIGTGLELLRKALKGVFSIAKAGLGIIKVGLNIAGRIVSMLVPVANGLLSVAAGIGDFLNYAVDFASSLFSSETAIATINAALQPFANILQVVGGMLFMLGDGITKIVELARSATNFEALGEMLKLNPEENKNAIAIYNFLVSIRDMALKLKPAFDTLVASAKAFFSTAKTWLSGKVEKIIGNIATFFTNLWNTIKEGNYPEKILNGIATVLQVILGIVAGVGYGFYSLVKALVSGAKAMIEFVKNSQFFQNVWAGIQRFFTPVREFFASIWKSLTNLRGLFPTFKTFEQFWSAFLSQMANNPIGSKFIKPLGKIKSALSKPINAIKSFVGGISVAFNALKKFGNTDNALDELMKDPEKNRGAINVIKFLQTIHNILAKIGPIVSSVKQTVSNVFSRVGKAVKEFGSSVWTSIKSFFGADGENEFENLGKIFDGIVNWLSTAWTDVSNWVNDVLLKSPFIQNLIEFGKLVWQAIKDFFSMDTSDVEGLGNKLLARLSAFDPVIDWIKDKMKGLKEALSGEDGILKQVQKFFSTDENSILGTILKYVENVGNFFVDQGLEGVWNIVKTGFKAFILTTIVRAIGRLSKSFAILTGAAKPAKGLGESVKELAISIAIIAGALWLLSKTPADKALAGVGVMTLALAAMVGAMALMNKIGKGVKDAGIGILSMAAGLALVVLAIWGMSQVIQNTDPEVLTQSLIYVGGILVALGAIAFIISKWGKAGGSVGGAALIAAMCLGLVAVVYSIGELAKLIRKYPDDIDEAFWKVEIIIGTLGAIAFVISKWGKTGGSIGGALMIVAMCWTLSTIVDAIGKMITLIKKYPNDIDSAFWMVEGILITIGAIAAIISAVAGKSSGTLGTLAAIAPILAIGYSFEMIADAMTKAILAVSGVDVEVLNTFMGRLEGTIAILASVCALFAAVPLSASIKAAVALVVLMGAIGLGLDIAATFVADAMDKMSSALWLVGSRMSDFSDMTSDYNSDGVSAVMDSLTDTILPALGDVFLKADSVSGAAEVAKDIWRFGIALKLFNNSISGISEDSGRILSEFTTKISESVNTINAIEGVEDAADLLNRLGGAIKLYYLSLNGMSADENTGEIAELPKVDSSVAQAAFDQLSKITVDDDTLKKISSYGDNGDHDLGAFAGGIINLSSALEEYGNSIGKLKSEDINTANGVIDKVVGIQETLNKVNNIGDFLLILSGKRQDLTDFGLDLAALGEAMATYGESVSGLNVGKVMMGNMVLDAVSKINEKLPTTGGLWQMLAGEKKLGDFAVNMSDLGSGMAEYADKVSKADFKNVEASVGPIEALAAINANLDKSGGIVGLFEGEKNLATIGNGLEEFGTNLMGFYQTVSDFNAESKPLQDALGILGTLVDIQSRIKVLEDAQSGLGLGELAWEFGQFFDVMSGGEGGDVRWAIENGIEAIRGYYDNFKDAGIYLDEGLAAGILAGRSKPIKAAAWTAAFTLEKALNVLGIHSPSVVFKWAGEMLDMGLANGLIEKTSVVTSAIENLSDETTGGLYEGLKGMQNIINGALDEVPEISPVLDLSNVKEEAGKIAGMLAGQTIGTSLNLANGISTGKGVTIIQGAGDNSQVVEAINTLNERMNSVVGFMANLRVVMDTGALVGQIVGPMDQQLGIRASRSSRRG